jgi:hypothetical protein
VNRIVQRHFPYSSVKDLEALHDSFLRVLGVSVPPSVTALYATPRVSDEGAVQWYTSFAGQPIPYAELPESAAIQLRVALFERLRAIAHFAAAYSAQPTHDPSLLKILQEASAEPALEAIYSVGGQPVLLFWDRAIVADTPRKILAAPLIPLVAASATKSPYWQWLLASLLVLLLLFLLWWFLCPRSPLNIVELPIEVPAEQPVVVVTPEPEPPKPVVVPPPPEPVHVPKPADLPVIDPEPVPEPAPEPEPIPAPEPPKPPKPVPPPPPKPKPVVKPPATITTAKNLCPEDRPAALAPDMVVVFDSSG